MWCIGTLTEEYRGRMYNLLKLYAKPLRCDEPVICIDEKSLQLTAHSRAPLPMAPSASAASRKAPRPWCGQRAPLSPTPPTPTVMSRPIRNIASSMPR